MKKVGLLLKIVASLFGLANCLKGLFTEENPERFAYTFLVFLFFAWVLCDSLDDFDKEKKEAA